MIGSLVVLSGCGGAVAATAFTCDEACELAFSRVTSVTLTENAPVGGSFHLLGSGLNEKTSFSNGGNLRGQKLERENLGRLWVMLDSPALSAALKDRALSETCHTQTNTFITSKCLRVKGDRQTVSGCWCGPPPAGPVRDATNELSALYELAFPPQ